MKKFLKKTRKNGITKFVGIARKIVSFFANRDNQLIAYKLSYDALVLAVASFALVLIFESLIPGFISTRISMAKFVFAILAILGLILLLAKILKIKYVANPIKEHKFLPIFIMGTFLLIGNSLLKFALWENLIITLVSIYIFFLLYEIIFSTEK